MHLMVCCSYLFLVISCVYHFPSMGLIVNSQSFKIFCTFLAGSIGLRHIPFPQCSSRCVC